MLRVGCISLNEFNQFWLKHIAFVDSVKLQIIFEKVEPGGIGEAIVTSFVSNVGIKASTQLSYHNFFDIYLDIDMSQRTVDHVFETLGCKTLRQSVAAQIPMPKDEALHITPRRQKYTLPAQFATI